MGNHPSANHYLQDVTAYIGKETGERAMLGPFSYLYSADVARAYRQADCPLVCFTFTGAFYINISLPFGLQ